MIEIPHRTFRKTLVYRDYTLSTYVYNGFHIWRVKNRIGALMYHNSVMNGHTLPNAYGIYRAKEHVDEIILAQKIRLKKAIKKIEEERCSTKRNIVASI